MGTLSSQCSTCIALFLYTWPKTMQLRFLPVWGWVFGFFNTRQFWVFEKNSGSKKTTGSRLFEKFQNQRTAGSGYFEKKRFKEPLVLGTLEKKIQIQRTAGSGYLGKKNQIQRTAGSGYLGKKNQIQRTAGSGYLKNFNESSSGFMKALAKTGQFWEDI